MHRPVLIASLLLVLASHTSAHNNFFLPGDAFFSFTITETQASKLAEGKGKQDLKVEYARLDNHFMACGNLGYLRLHISDLSDKFRSNLSQAYSAIRNQEIALYRKGEENSKEELTEWNPVVGLVYNEDKAVMPLGLKYNENWNTQGHGYYGGFLTDGKSVAIDWRRAADVAPLQLRPPLVQDFHFSTMGAVYKLVAEPIKIKASEIEIYLVGFLKKNSWVKNECPNLEALAQKKSWASYYKITETGFTFHEYEKGELKSYKFDSNGRRVEITKSESATDP